MNVNPNVWGPNVWASMHTLAKASDEGQLDGTAFAAWVASLADMLPCEKCRNDFTELLQRHGTPVKGQAFVWSVGVHNWVNQKLGKPLVELKDALARWTTYDCNDCKAVGPTNQEPNKTSSTNFSSIFLLTILLVLCALFGLYGFVSI